GASAPGPELIFYLTGSGDSLVLALDSTGLAVGSGTAYAQSATPLQLSGNVGFNGFNLPRRSAGSVNDVTGQLTLRPDPSSMNLVVAGVLDGATQGNPVTGLFSDPGTSGRFPGSLSASSFFGLPDPVPLEIYLIDDHRGFMIETDSSLNGSVFLGYF